MNQSDLSPRVLITTRYDASSVGGVESVVRSLLPRMSLARPDWRITHFHSLESTDLIARLPLFGDIWSSVRFAIELSRGNYSLAVINGAEYAWAPLLIRRFRKRRVVVVWHGTRYRELDYVTVNTAWSRVVIRVLKGVYYVLERVACTADGMIAVSQGVADSVIDKYHPAPSIVVIPNAVDEPKATGITPIRGRVLWVGTNAIKKGLSEAIETARIAAMTMPDLRLVVVGQRSAPKQADAPWLDWRGRVAPDEMPGIYASAEVLLHPAPYEPFGMAVLEAMSYGVAVVGSQVVAWLVGDGGVTVDNWNPRSYAAAVTELLQPGSDLPSVRRRAAQRAREFTWEKSADRYVSYLEKMGAGRQLQI